MIRWPRELGPIQRVALLATLAVSLLVLLFHVRLYAFLCDDAFISFRYARNFAEGHGLVFNPGHERVEGYSNFLWVMVLALGRALGIAPERAALPLSAAATVALWLAVVGFAARRAPARDVWATVALPAILLAANRSFAVWGTSGLETRAFELFVVCGVLQLSDELGSESGRAPRSPWWFALAALTRPDGALFGATSLGAAAVVLARRGTLDPRRFARDVAPFVLAIAAHEAFRLSYYGAWLPNTFMAKVGGRLWWDSGLAYLVQFAIEYALVLWLPLAIVGAIARRRAGAGHEPVLFAAALAPHALYVAAIGGDHFEYRPLDVAFPLLFLLAGFGVARLMRLGDAALAAPDADPSRRAARALPPPRTRMARRLAIGAYVVLAAWAAFELPWRSHVEFPRRYLPGFPGESSHEPERRAFLDPGGLGLYRVPGFATLARAHRALLRTSTRRLVGIRAEEHARFLATVLPEGARLRALVANGTLPRDTYIATGAVGAIPYASNLRTLDRLGLTDALVARGAPQALRVMAHDRSASLEEGRARGVDLWAAHDVHFVWPVGSPHPVQLAAQGVGFHAAPIGDDACLVVLLPQGLEHARRRFPRLEFLPGDADAFLIPWLAKSRAALRDSLARGDDDAVRRDLALLLMLEGRSAEALEEYRRILALHPEDALQTFHAAECLAALGRDDPARDAWRRALALATADRDLPLASRIARRMAMAGAPGATGGGPGGP